MGNFCISLLKIAEKRGGKTDLRHRLIFEAPHQDLRCAVDDEVHLLPHSTFLNDDFARLDVIHRRHARGQLFSINWMHFVR
jgi:hypothetical protein